MQENELVQPSLSVLLKDATIAENYINDKLLLLAENGFLPWFVEEFTRESQLSAEAAYPSQGLIRSLYDGHEINHADVRKFDHEEFRSTVIPGMLYYLELFNHPERMNKLRETLPFTPPKQNFSRLFFVANLLNQAISINQLALSPQGHEDPRMSRTEKFMEGPFTRLGDQPRSLLVGSANPEVWGSVASIAHMAQTHSLVGVPRDGLFSNITRQADLSRAVFSWLERSPVLIGRDKTEGQELLRSWKHNVMGVLEVGVEKGLKRAEALYEVGVRTFRPYSPEPGSDLVMFVRALRQLEKTRGWEHVEIFSGQVISVEQAKELEHAGATGIYVGVGGGGRCKTGVRSGVAIDWPMLIWKLRGRSHIPIIIEGGASDYIAQTLAVGGTGIGVTRIVAGGTVESPGGLSYFKDGDGLFKPYGGEASGRVKSFGGKIGPYGIIPYEEGEVAQAFMQFGRGNLPTLLSRAFLLNGDVILAFVFQNAKTIAEFQRKAVKTLQITSPMELSLRIPHG